jgi:hypothetical protein
MRRGRRRSQSTSPSKGCDASKLTIPELEAVARVVLATTLKGKYKGEKVAMFKSKVSEMSWDPRARAEARHGSSGKGMRSRRLPNQVL